MKPEDPQVVRRLTSKETHDLSMIIKDRTKVLRAHAEEQAAHCLADFENKISQIFKFDSDDVWKKVAEEAAGVIAEANRKIEARCAKLGIPKEFAPGLELKWHARGQNATSGRRDELRRVAKSQIEAMKKAAVTKIEKQSLDLRTQVVTMGILSMDGKLFLESLAPVEEAMHSLDFAAIELSLAKENADRKRLGGPRYG